MVVLVSLVQKEEAMVHKNLGLNYGHSLNS